MVKTQSTAVRITSYVIVYGAIAVLVSFISPFASAGAIVAGMRAYNKATKYATAK